MFLPSEKLRAEKVIFLKPRQSTVQPNIMQVRLRP
jgi:hypothetical protein